MSVRINDKVIAGTYTPQSYRYVGEIFQSILPINDVRVAPLDGRKIYDSDGHGGFIQYLNSLVALYPQLACTEDEWQLSNTTYGECGKFVVNEDGSIRLPKIVSFIQGLSSLQDLATLVEAGLPNIRGTVVATQTGGIPVWVGTEDGFSGALSVDPTQKSYTPNAGSGGAIQRSVSGTLTLDASLSNPIYGNSTTVQPQSIRYPYYIVLATGVTQELRVKEELTTNIPFTLFESKYSELELNNTSWLLSSGQWNSKELYPSAYNELVKEYNAGSNKYSIKLHTEEYDDYDFVLNLDNETFRLPLLDGSENMPDYSKRTQLTASLEDQTINQDGFIYWESIGAGNSTCYLYINGKSVGISRYNASSGTGGSSAFVRISKGDTYKVALVSTSTLYFYPAQGNGSLYFYVGDTNINVSLVDTGKLTQEVANLIPNNSSLISSYALPSTEVIPVEWGASASFYLSPCNGWFYVARDFNGYGDGWLSATVRPDNNPNSPVIYSILTSGDDALGVTIPVRKGQYVRVGYDTATVGSAGAIQFIKAQGEV